ncbi:hypothetical protein NESM_000364200 [Novymonas esmeraldas]|uniref:Uncharacterized protein n=1 Tax=Novymonas esmeraldas TaxID=1808958 RepID=A0AAW0EMN7_9TRYP
MQSSSEDVRGDRSCYGRDGAACGSDVDDADSLSDTTSSCHGHSAAEELRGHLLDCVSLYPTRFLDAEASAACIQPLSCITPHAGDDAPPIADAGLNLSTMATVLRLHVAAVPATSAASAASSLRGVVVAFAYHLGFFIVAERVYASEMEARDEAAVLSSSQRAVSTLLTADPTAWRCRAAPAAALDLPELISGCSDAADSLQADARPPAHTVVFESLTALLVNTFL